MPDDIRHRQEHIQFLEDYITEITDKMEDITGGRDYAKDIRSLEYRIETLEKSDNKDLTDKIPSLKKELEELKKVFVEEAWENNVYPMYDDMLARLNKVNYVLFGDKKEFTYYAPGAVRIAEKASAPVKDATATRQSGRECYLSAFSIVWNSSTAALGGGSLVARSAASIASNSSCAPPP